MSRLLTRLGVLALAASTLSGAASAATPPSGDALFLEDYAEARARARSLERPLLLDLYTDWCAPCRRMSAEVFPDPRVTAVLTRDFVPVKLDAEADTNAALVARLGVSQFPTLVVLDADGAELHRSVGFLGAEEFVAFAKESTNAQANGAALLGRYASGARAPEFLRELVAYARQASLPQASTYIAEYLSAADAWDTPEGQELLFGSVRDADGPLFAELVARQARLGARFGPGRVAERIGRLTDATLFPEGEDAERPSHRRARAILARAYPSRADSAYVRYRMRVAREAGRTRRFGRWALRWERGFPPQDAGELDELIYVFESRLPGWREATVAEWRRRLAALE